MRDWMPSVTATTPTTPPDANVGLARLAKLVETEDAAEATAQLAALLEDAEGMDALAAAWRSSPDRVAALTMRLGAKKGMRQRANRLERAIREAAVRQSRAETEGRLQVAMERSTALPLAEALAPVLGAHVLPAGLRCPPGWEVSPRGVAKLRVSPESGNVNTVDVAHRPLLIEGRYRDVHDNSVTYALAWAGAGGGWHLHPVPRAKAADARGLVAYAAHDAPVTSNSASDLVAFLDDFEAANLDAIPEARVTSQMGWHGAGDERCFLWGRSVVRAGGTVSAGAVEDLPPARWVPRQLHLLVTEPGVRALADGFRSTGTWEGWLDAVNAALPYPAAMVALYASLVPPLMAFFPTLANFIVDFCGETSRGKTTTLRLAASVWGNPDERGGGIVVSWDNTRVYVERAAALTDYLPTFLDDTKRARKSEDVGRTLYDFASGVGRGRGSLQGIQRTSRSHGVLLSTGEAPATSFTNDGGTRARTLCIWGSPFGGCSAETLVAVQRITAGVLDHYGHAGPRLLQYLLGLADAGAGLRRLYAWRVAEWTKLCNGNPVAGRAAQYVAALDVAKWLLHEALGVPAPSSDPVLIAWHAVIKASAEADRASDALRDLLSWATSQQHRFYGRLEGEPSGNDAPTGGWLGAWASRADWRTLAVLPTELRGFLERQKYDAEAVLRVWEQRGWLLRDEGHRTRKATIGERKERCFVVARAGADAVSGEAAEADPAP